MDGVFVPNLTFGPDVIAACRQHVGVMFEAHLMVADPDPGLGAYIDAGCEMLIVHAESVTHLHRTLSRVAELGARAAVAINPATPNSAVAHVLDLVDMVLVMTVNPGFGGQQYITAMEPKITALRGLIDDSGSRGASGRGIDIEVDGGISADTVGGAAAAGANVLVSGSALFGYGEGLRSGVSDLRRRAEAAICS